MHFRKFVRFLFPLLLCALLWKPLSLIGMGAFARLYVYFDQGLVLDYSSLLWTRQGVLIFDASLTKKDAFCLEIPQGVIQFQKKHLLLEKPHLILWNDFQMKEGKDLGWTFSLVDGTVEGVGIQRARFSLERTDLDHLARLALHWPEGELSLEMRSVPSGISIDAAWKDLNPRLLSRWLGDRVSGSTRGAVHLKAEQGVWKECFGEMDGSGIAIEGFCNDLQGSIHWSAPLDGEALWEKGDLRLHVEAGTFCVDQTSLEKIQGELSYLGGNGARWHFSAQLLKQPFLLDGRLFASSKLHAGQSWMETMVKCGEGSMVLSGQEVLEGRTWVGVCHGLEPPFVHWVQELAALSNPDWKKWSLLKGILNGSFHCFESRGEILSSEIDTFYGENIRVEKGEMAFECDLISLEKCAYSFEGGTFSFPLTDQQTICGTDWRGGGHLERGNHSFEGSCGSVDFAFSCNGSFDSFEGMVQTKGNWIAIVPFNGSWEGGALQFSVRDADLEGFHLSGRGGIEDDFRFFFKTDCFSGSLTPLLKVLKQPLPLRGNIFSAGHGFSFLGSKSGWDWALEARIEEGNMTLFSSATLDSFQCDLHADSSGVVLYDVKGALSWGKRFSFYAPIFATNGDFDVRLEGATWDFARFAGTFSERSVLLDPKKSHFLGSSICLTHFDREKEALDLSSILSWERVSAFLGRPSQFVGCGIEGDANLRFFIEKNQGALFEIRSSALTWKGQPLDLSCSFRQERDLGWRFELSEGEHSSISALFCFEPAFIQIREGKLDWEKGVEAQFQGRIGSFEKWELQFQKIHADCKDFSSWSLSSIQWPEKIEGVLEGSGLVSFGPTLEADFDFVPPTWKIYDRVQTKNLNLEELDRLNKDSSELWTVENRTPIHLYYSSDKGFLFRGLDFSIGQKISSGSWIDGKIGLLQYDFKRSSWLAAHAHCHFSSESLEMAKMHLPSLSSFPIPERLDFLADFEWAFDFSSFSCSMKEGFLPCFGEVRHVQNLHFFWTPQEWRSYFDLFYQAELFKVGLLGHVQPNQTGASKINGRLWIQDELSVDWVYEDQLSIQAIEGTFAGMELSFHPEGEFLIGSGRVDCNAISDLVPPQVARVFRELKMGKGYELMGRMKLSKEGFFFQGILSGKQVELFDYQLRTLLAQVDISPSHVKIYDLKISDSAGVMKIDQILAQGEGDAPWTLLIPHLTIFELRPSLIQKVGKPPGSISPLVVRKLTIEDFKGLVDDSKTYTARGELHFINSYKREHTVFDIPSDVLSRIVGLDLDLLVPVCGTLRYELKEGRFQLTELTGAYSENKRSEFFLVKTENSPTVDLDGNLNILIQMKQFVLFKLTEAFIISVDGKLDDPGFHLQKKKRFLGL